jgi:hypothetical protein
MLQHYRFVTVNLVVPASIYHNRSYATAQAYDLLLGVQLRFGERP